MRINYANIGILEIVMICLVTLGCINIFSGNNIRSITGRIIAFITLLSYVLLKAISL